jgi:hypothetical protein
MEVVGSSETSVPIYEYTASHPGDSNLHRHSGESLKFHDICLYRHEDLKPYAPIYTNICRWNAYFGPCLITRLFFWFGTWQIMILITDYKYFFKYSKTWL